jgi:hypothetical protein
LLNLLPRPLSAGFAAGLSAGPGQSLGLPRRSATRWLGPYRDRTLTGKPCTAYLDALPLPFDTRIVPWEKAEAVAQVAIQIQEADKEDRRQLYQKLV